MQKIPNNTITRNLTDFSEQTGNVYKTVVAISKRANEIAQDDKFELQKKLQEFSGATDNLEETFENREQIEISRYYEKMPKPVIVATEEYLQGNMTISDPEKEIL